MKRTTWTGRVVDGLGRVSADDQLPAGWTPGSLNLEPVDAPLRPHVEHRPPPGWNRDELLGSPTITPATLLRVPVLLLHYDHDLWTDVVARQHLRTALGLRNGDEVEVEIPESYLR